MSARLILLVIVFLSVPALAYWADDHKSLNQQLACSGRPWDDAGFMRSGQPVRLLGDYARRVLYLNDPGSCQRPTTGQTVKGVGYDLDYPSGFDTPDDAPSESHTVLEWNRLGGFWEDGFKSMGEATMWGGRRAVNHFHDPLNGNGGYTGIADLPTGSVVPFMNLLRRGTSATSWVMNGEGLDVGEKNLWGYRTIGDCFHRAFTERTNDKREAGVACVFRALGQVEHLIEDNTVPDHTRDLAHPGNGWEEYVRDTHQTLFTTTPKPWVVFPLKLVESGGLRAVWDRDVYTGANPELTLVGNEPAGLSEFVNANFYAWNVYSVGPADVPFSTIPDEPGQGFKRTITLTPTNPVTVLQPRYNPAEFPFPKWNEDGSTLLRAEPGTLPQVVAHRTPNSTTLDETPAVWVGWEEPLMKRALGYAQTAISLALPPARMEVVPAMNGDPLRFSLRLWNLWPAGSPHAVTWHVDALKLVSLRPNKDRDQPFVDEAPIDVPAGFDVAPGANHQTDELTLTWRQRAAFRYGSHAALLVTAHLGSGNTRTDLRFTVLAPNAVVWVKQTAGQDLSAVFNNNTQNCSTATCSYEGESGVYRNPGHQRVTGTIELAAARVDALGHQADGELNAIQARDARVAAVALVAFSRESTLEVLHPVQSRLMLSGSQWTASPTPGVFVRSSDAPDEPDPTQLTFEADLQLSDFYRPDLGTPMADATRTSGTIYLAVWTTAGSVQLQRLIVWPWLNPDSAQAVTTPQSCQVGDVPHQALIGESRGICQHSAMTTSPSCAQFTFHRQRVELSYADPGYAQQRALQNSVTDFILAFGNSSDVRTMTFAGRAVTLTGAAQLPTACDINAISQFYPAGNGDALCAGFAPTGLALFHAENEMGMGPCGGTPQPPSLPHVAEYQHVVLPDAMAWMRDNLGVQIIPTWSFTLN